jgi:hypothetical protein
VTTFYELRLYTLVPGRLDVAIDRFAHHLPRLFARHGIKNVGRWIASAGAGGPMFVYMMAYESLAQREAQWDAFYLDPEWGEVRSATQGQEEATERFELFFLRSNSLWAPPAAKGVQRIDGVHELILTEVLLGATIPAYAYLKEVYLPAIISAGATVMMAADFVTGPSLPRFSLMLAWADDARRREGWSKLREDRQIYESLADQRKRYGRTLLGCSDSYLLEPTAFDLPLAGLGHL